MQTCSRTIPTCAQCTSSGASCRYPSSNKRGIPTGYISVLERRLLETELALFEALCSLYKSPIPIDPYISSQGQREAIANYSYKQSKGEKVEEWSSCSLGTEYDRMSWWQSRCTIADADADRTPAGVELDYRQPGLERLESEDVSTPDNAHVSIPDTSAVSPVVVLPPQVTDSAPLEDASVVDWRRYF
ncbi:unnamed protein product [Periconia digitata]|uniref:Zn(2)-C6 fungal-type domain-containing protein n=1 Tax=Periconia digitata TaxID=1303443 RepID=A0A9W4UTG7_9PLEO|nr:unnamed protein product [Periconia digitata]